MRRWILLAGGGWMVWVTSTWAVPFSITYQGVLYESVGGVVTNVAAPSVGLEVRLYTEPTGGPAIWGRRVDNVPLDCGAFNLTLSDSIGAVLETGTLYSALVHQPGPLYIGLKIPGGEEIVPRQKVVSAGQAVVAERAHESLGDFEVHGKLTGKQSVEIADGVALQDTLNVQGSAAFSGAAQFGQGFTASGMDALFYTNMVLTPPAAVSGHGALPLGSIIVWSGSAAQIPAGWALCDGSTVNGRKTPDLRGRFVVAAGSLMGDTYTVGATGGLNKVTLTVDQLPKHRHDYEYERFSDFFGSGDHNKEVWTGHKEVQSGATGGSQPHENRPPFYALCFLMRVW